MWTPDILKCFAAHFLVRSHGVYFAAVLLAEQSVPFNLALEFLTSRYEDLCLKYLTFPDHGGNDESRKHGIVHPALEQE
jgi:hypothetical protein